MPDTPGEIPLLVQAPENKFEDRARTKPDAFVSHLSVTVAPVCEIKSVGGGAEMAGEMSTETPPKLSDSALSGTAKINVVVELNVYCVEKLLLLRPPLSDVRTRL